MSLPSAACGSLHLVICHRGYHGKMWRWPAKGRRYIKLGTTGRVPNLRDRTASTARCTLSLVRNAWLRTAARGQLLSAVRQVFTFVPHHIQRHSQHHCQHCLHPSQWPAGLREHLRIFWQTVVRCRPRGCRDPSTKNPKSARPRPWPPCRDHGVRARLGCPRCVQPMSWISLSVSTIRCSLQRDAALEARHRDADSRISLNRVLPDCWDEFEAQKAFRRSTPLRPSSPIC
mmetsp:Transcript_8713/g.24335  ORF Transcript_8713/g.24335 Transcript_8713/m.24335 type:complete len:230 (-) Transcript_8713:389-1078(-)